MCQSICYGTNIPNMCFNAQIIFFECAFRANRILEMCQEG